MNQGRTAPSLNDISTPGTCIEFPAPWIDEKRRDIMLLDSNVAETFLKRIEGNQCTTKDLPHDILPSLYIDFDEKELYSMYSEPASYEDYVPIGWKSEFKNFLNLIPNNEQYWKV